MIMDIVAKSSNDAGNDIKTPPGGSSRSVLLVEETGGHRENCRPVTSH
jgi:hypothetical protein